MRDYTHIDKFLDLLGTDIYPQPQDDGHSALAIEAINVFYDQLPTLPIEILDLGCGEGFCQEYFEGKGGRYTGVCLFGDHEVAVSKGKNVFDVDFSFLPFENNSYDFLFSRHSLEHSPMPLLTLMEWNRVSSKYLAVVLPAPEHWKYGGQNHYFVMNTEQWKVLFDVAGFEVSYESVKMQVMSVDANTPEVATEYWFLLEKKI